MTLTRCPSCGKPGITTVTVDRIYEVRGRRRLVRGVPVQRCPSCGGEFLDYGAAGEVDRALGLGRRRARMPAS